MTRAGDIVVVTPEHVEIVLTPAGLGSRFLALIVDLTLTLGVPLLAIQLLSPILSFGATAALQITLVFFFTFGYHVYFETRRQGRTPGKRALKLRVVDSRGLPITLGQSLVRNAMRALDVLPIMYGFGGAVSLADRNSRRFGDIAAQTVVVEERPSVDAQTIGLAERRFNSLRTPRILRTIRHRIGLEERELLLELLLRADALEPARRFEIMEEIAAYYRQLLDVDDPRLTSDNLVRDLTSIVFG